jgi:hypothetical protein
MFKENLLQIEQKRKPKGKRPSDVTRIPGTSLEVAMWPGTDSKSGLASFHFAISRLNSEGGSYRTLVPECLPELLSTVYALAAFFAEQSDLPATLREKLAGLVADIEGPVAKQTPIANGNAAVANGSFASRLALA